MFFWGKYLFGEQKKNAKPKHKLLCKQQQQQQLKPTGRTHRGLFGLSPG